MHASDHENESTIPLYVAFVVLLVLLVITTALSYIPLGMTGTWIGLSIAALKTVIIALIFMQLWKKASGGGTRLAAIAGVLWLSFAITITLSDYLTRGWGGTNFEALEEAVQYTSFDRVDFEEATQAPHKARGEGEETHSENAGGAQSERK